VANDKSKLPKIKKGLVFREEDEGAFVFDPVNDDLRCLNETGARIFELLDGKNTIDGIVKKMKSHYPDISEVALEKDVHSFVEDLRRRGILVE
jgi:hypothetical protein